MSKQKLQALIAYKEKVKKKYFAKGISGIDVGYKMKNNQPTDEISFRFHVQKKLPIDRIEKNFRLPKTLMGIKTDVIESNFELLTTITTLNVQSSTGLVDDNRYDVLQGGMQISPSNPVSMERDQFGNIVSMSFETGTLGAIVIDKNTNTNVLLTNDHVLSIDGDFNPTGKISQPLGGISGDIIGTNLRHVNNQEVDGAIASLNGNRPFRNSILEIGEIRGIAQAELNEFVRKRGRTTQLTEGRISSVSGTYQINTSEGLKVYNNIISITSNSNYGPFSGPGDSGSVVVNDQNKMIGLLFAGTPSFTLVCPIHTVFNDLNIEVEIDDHNIFIDDYPVIKLGDRGEYVKELQQLLNKTPNSSLIADGIFGKMTLQKVLVFQNKNNLIVDGIVGIQTWTHLISLS